MGGTYYKNSTTNGLFQIKNATVRTRGGSTVFFGGVSGTTSATATVVPGVPAGQLVGSSMISPATNATIAAAGINKSSARPVFKPYSAGAYAQTRAGEYIMLGESSKIAGVANTLLKCSGADTEKRRSQNRKTYLDRSFKVTDISYITGALTGSAKTYYWRSIGSAATHTETVVTTLQDHEVKPNTTKTIPGEFTISETGKTPTNKDYDAKTD